MSGLGWVCAIIALALMAIGATVEGAIWFLMAIVDWKADDIIRAIQKGAE